MPGEARKLQAEVHDVDTGEPTGLFAEKYGAQFVFHFDKYKGR